MQEKLAVTTRTRRCCTQSREMLFSLLNLTEHTMMKLTDATLDQKMSELFTRLYLGSEQCGCGEQTMVGLFDAFLAFSRMGARRLPRTLRALEAWRRLTPSRRRKPLMLGCWAAICWRLVERGHVQMAPYVLVGLSAHSRPSTLARRRCDLVKPAKEGSRFWALLQHPQEARPSKTLRYDEGCFLDSPNLDGLEDLFLKNVGCVRPPTNLEFHVPTSGQCSTASCCRNWAGNSNPLPTASLRRQRGHGSTISNVGCCSEKRSLVAAKSMRRYEHSSRIAADYGKLPLEVRTLCEECEKHLRQIMLEARHPWQESEIALNRGSGYRTFPHTGFANGDAIRQQPIFSWLAVPACDVHRLLINSAHKTLYRLGRRGPISKTQFFHADAKT